MQYIENYGLTNYSLKTILSTILKYPIFNHKCSHCTENICSVFWRNGYFISRWLANNFSPRNCLQHSRWNKRQNIFFSFGCLFVVLKSTPAIFHLFSYRLLMNTNFEKNAWKFFWNTYVSFANKPLFYSWRNVCNGPPEWLDLDRSVLLLRSVQDCSITNLWFNNCLASCFSAVLKVKNNTGKFLTITVSTLYNQVCKTHWMFTIWKEFYFVVWERDELEFSSENSIFFFFQYII